MPLPSAPKPDHGRDDRHTSQLWRLSGMGSELAITILAMALVGYLIDRWLGSRPWGIMIGVGIGVLVGGYNFIKKATSVSRQAAADYRAEHPNGPTRPHPPEFSTPDDTDDAPDTHESPDDPDFTDDDPWPRDPGDDDDHR